MEPLKIFDLYFKIPRKQIELWSFNVKQPKGREVYEMTLRDLSHSMAVTWFSSVDITHLFFFLVLKRCLHHSLCHVLKEVWSKNRMKNAMTFWHFTSCEILIQLHFAYRLRMKLAHNWTESKTYEKSSYDEVKVY